MQPLSRTERLWEENCRAPAVGWDFGDFNAHAANFSHKIARCQSIWPDICHNSQSQPNPGARDTLIKAKALRIDGWVQGNMIRNLQTAQSNPGAPDSLVKNQALRIDGRVQGNMIRNLQTAQQAQGDDAVKRTFLMVEAPVQHRPCSSSNRTNTNLDHGNHHCNLDCGCTEALRLETALFSKDQQSSLPASKEDVIAHALNEGNKEQDYAQQVFDRSVHPNECSYNSHITDYLRCGELQHALTLYHKMQECDDVLPNCFTVIALLKACAELKDLGSGHRLHVHIARKGFLETDVFVGSSLLNMYVKCGAIAKAQHVFNKLPIRNVVTWNALIAGYIQHGSPKKALDCYDAMRSSSISPDAFTFACTLKACGISGAIDKGQDIHAQILRRQLLERNHVLGTAVVDMYAKCRIISKAQEVFDKLPVRNVVSWNALITGYVQLGHGQEALNCYKKMQLEDISPTVVTFLGTLKACGITGAIDQGYELHAKIAKNGSLERDPVVGTALVDMYCKCGLLSEAQEIFDGLSVRHAVSWNALIAGYAQLGKTEHVFRTFDKMIKDNKKPCLITFISVLNACNHEGLVDKGLMYMETMTKDHNLIPTREHYTCMVDLFGRVGQLDKAVAMIKNIPIRGSLVMWNAVLSAAVRWGNVVVGRQAFEHAIQLDEKDPTTYICMSNIYINAGMWENAKQIEAMRRKMTNFRETERSLGVG